MIDFSNFLNYQILKKEWKSEAILSFFIWNFFFEVNEATYVTIV